MDNKNPTKPVLGSPRTAEELLDIYFLDMRSALLETAATLDRIERAENGTGIFRDPRIRKLTEACEVLKSGKQNRVEQFLVLFSDPLE
ncbi:MAG: hypothetical protein JRJ65_20525 [Deltaproteobacteria bacterium]|nr:hypothetical protein [Deltaproteobacteria bacterium]